jgi:hypothetical protein
MTHDPGDRIRSYELLADVADLDPDTVTDHERTPEPAAEAAR